MRNSVDALIEAYSLTYLSNDTANDSMLAESNIYGNANNVNSQGNDGQHGFYSKLEESAWLYHIRAIIKASVLVAEKLHLEGASVLVHCSDGW